MDTHMSDLRCHAPVGRFREGDRVVHVTASDVPEGITGTVLGQAGWPHGDRWEVEYDNFPCTRGKSYTWEKSETSWISRDSSIELTREAAMQRNREGVSA